MNKFGLIEKIKYYHKTTLWAYNFTQLRSENNCIHCHNSFKYVLFHLVVQLSLDFNHTSPIKYFVHD